MSDNIWEDNKALLARKIKEAVAKFAAENSTEKVCYFGLDSDPGYGYVLTCFNTTEADRQFVKSSRSRNVEYTYELLRGEQEETLYSQMKTYSLLPFCNNPEHFKFQGYTQIDFPEWAELSKEEGLLESDEYEDSYLYRNIAKFTWEVLRDLSADGTFNALNLASPCFVGFGFHDDEMIIVEILNIPD